MLDMGVDGQRLLALAGTPIMNAVMRKVRRLAGACLITALAGLAFAANDLAQAGDPPPQGKRAACDRSAFRVVVDVGHTVDVPGALSARGVPEYSFNLQLADTINATLLGAGFAKTVRLITATAPWPGLVERATRANDMHADLFISIHHDSVPDYLLETWQYGGEERQFSDRFSGYALFVSNDNGDRAGSLAFGHLLGKELQARGLHYTPHYTLPLMGHYRHELLDPEAGIYRYDHLVVLQQTHMPAVLLEAGSIINRQEELELSMDARRALVGGAVAAAVEAFCAARARPSADRPSKRPAKSS
jgi:N-acetylmuramoyl-L-alanine amidase